MGHAITSVRDDGDEHWTIEYANDDDGTGYGVSIPKEAVANRMAAYDFTDPAEALLSCIHEAYWRLIKPDPRDDPALIQGWVTTTEPDSERVHLYTARSGADAAGAHKARIDACKAVMGLTDPDGLLPAHTPTPDRVRYHREMTDTARWANIYGDLPEPPRRARGIPIGAPRA